MSQLTSDNLIQKNGFKEESLAWPEDKSVVSLPALKDMGIG